MQQRGLSDGSGEVHQQRQMQQVTGLSDGSREVHQHRQMQPVVQGQPHEGRQEQTAPDGHPQQPREAHQQEPGGVAREIPNHANDQAHLPLNHGQWGNQDLPMVDVSQVDASLFSGLGEVHQLQPAGVVAQESLPTSSVVFVGFMLPDLSHRHFLQELDHIPKGLNNTIRILAGVDGLFAGNLAACQQALSIYRVGTSEHPIEMGNSDFMDYKHGFRDHGPLLRILHSSEEGPAIYPANDPGDNSLEILRRNMPGRPVFVLYIYHPGILAAGGPASHPITVGIPHDIPATSTAMASLSTGTGEGDYQSFLERHFGSLARTAQRFAKAAGSRRVFIAQWHSLHAAFELETQLGMKPGRRSAVEVNNGAITITREQLLGFVGLTWNSFSRIRTSYYQAINILDALDQKLNLTEGERSYKAMVEALLADGNHVLKGDVQVFTATFANTHLRKAANLRIDAFEKETKHYHACLCPTGPRA